MDAADVGILAVYVLGGGAAVAYGARRGTVAQAALGALGVVAALWALAAAATATGWKDADGWIDCGDHCSALQYVTGGALAGGILVGLPLLLIALVALARSSGRGERA